MKTIDYLIQKIKDKKSARLALFLIFLRWTFTWTDTLLRYKLQRTPFVDPYVPIPKKNYYFYQLFFLIPYGIFLFFIECSTAQLFLRLFKVKNDFREVMLYYAMTALGLWPLFGPLDLILVLKNKWASSLVIPYHTAAALVGGLSYSVGIRKMYQLSWPKSLLTGMMSMMAYRPLAVILIR